MMTVISSWYHAPFSNISQLNLANAAHNA